MFYALSALHEAKKVYKEFRMKTLIFGAGPLGSLYAHLLHKAGKNVTLLARDEHYTFLKENGLVLINEFTEEKIVDRVLQRTVAGSIIILHDGGNTQRVDRSQTLEAISEIIPSLKDKGFGFFTLSNLLSN